MDRSSEFRRHKDAGNAMSAPNLHQKSTKLSIQAGLPQVASKELASENNSGLLIPESLLEVHTQRLLVASIFVALQSFKVYRVLEDGISSSNFWLFTVADTAFFATLPVLMVPWLILRPWACLALSTLFAFVNANLFIDHGLVPSVIGAFWYYALKGGASGDAQRLQRTYANRLKGSYSVSHLPGSSVNLTSAGPLCLLNNERAFVHLTAVNAIPSYVELCFSPYEPYEEDWTSQAVAYTKDQLADLPNHSSKNGGNAIHELWVPVELAGKYRLCNFVDEKSQLSVKITGQNETVHVPECPQLDYVTTDHEYCEGELIEPEILLSGAGKLTAVISGQKPVDFKPPLPLMFTRNETVKLQSYVAGKESHAKITQVLDEFGNRGKILSNFKSPKIRRLPSAELRVPAKLPVVSGEATVEVHVTGEMPLVLEYSIDGTVKQAKVRTGLNALKIGSPGVLELLSIKSGRCRSGSGGQVELFVPPLLTIDSSFTMLEDDCTGPGGAVVDVNLSGTPPFTVDYEILHNNKVVDRKTKTVRGQQDQILFKPRSVGDWTYRLVSVTDRYQKTVLDNSKTHQRSQTVDRLLSARILPSLRTSYCPNDEVVVPIELTGKGDLTVELKVGDHIVTSTLPAGEHLVPVPLLPDGEHKLSVVSVKDLRNCTRIMDQNVRALKVRQLVPHAEFSSPGELKGANIQDQPLSIPLNLTNMNLPCNIAYQINDGPIERTKLYEPVLKASKVGSYVLLNASDSCSGTVGNSTVFVSQYEKPEMVVVMADERVCRGSPAIFKFNVTGTPPFKFFYQAKNPEGEIYYETKETSDFNYTMVLPPLNEPGVYTSKFWMTDSMYTEVEQSNTFFVTTTVQPDPVASFRYPFSEISFCPSDLREYSIPLIMRGDGPFDVLLEASHIDTGRTFVSQSIIPDVAMHELKNIFEEIGTGAFDIRLLRVADRYGCKNGAVANSNERVRISTKEQPQIKDPSLLSRHYCQESKLALEFQGSGEIQLEYTFNGKKFRSYGPEFVFHSEAPGMLKLLSLSDRSECRADLSTLPAVEFHPLPGVYLSGHKDHELREGQDAKLRFSFDGTAPFTFTYVRKVDNKIVEKETIENWNDSTFLLTTSKAGSYEIIELKDAFCSVFAE